MSDKEQLMQLFEHAVNKAWGVGFDYIILELLKESEPRVLTLEEVPDAVFCYLEYKAYGTIEPAIFGEADIDDTVAFTTLEDGKDYLDLSDYCKAWRCWTAKPTDEQREAVKWE